MGAVARKNIINLNNGLVNRLFSTGTRVANTEVAIDSIGDVPLQSRSMVAPTMRPMLRRSGKSRSSINQWEINSLQTLKRGLLRPLSCFPSYTFPRERPHAQFEPLSGTGERTSRPTTVCDYVRSSSPARETVSFHLCLFAGTSRRDFPHGSTRVRIEPHCTEVPSLSLGSPPPFHRLTFCSVLLAFGSNRNVQKCYIAPCRRVFSL